MLSNKKTVGKLAGFTMIELLAVVTIMAILFAIGIVSYTNASRNARDNRRISDITNLRQALVLYRSDNGCYPAALDDLIPDYWSELTIPTDPKNHGDYVYGGNSSASCPAEFADFSLKATIEKTGADYIVTNP